MSQRKPLSIGRYIVFCMLALEESTCTQMFDKCEGLISSSHIHSIIQTGIKARHLKVARTDNSVSGPPARVMKLTAKGATYLKAERARFKKMGL